MLDVVFLIAILGLTVGTALYVFACDLMLRTDSTLETVHHERWHEGMDQSERGTAG